MKLLEKRDLEGKSEFKRPKLAMAYVQLLAGRRAPRGILDMVMGFRVPKAFSEGSESIRTVYSQARMFYPKRERLEALGLRVMFGNDKYPSGLFINPTLAIDGRIFPKKARSARAIASLLFQIPGAIRCQQWMDQRAVRGVIVPAKYFELVEETCDF